MVGFEWVIKSVNLVKGWFGRFLGLMNVCFINVSWLLRFLMVNGLELIKIYEDYFYCNK